MEFCIYTHMFTIEQWTLISPLDTSVCTSADASSLSISSTQVAISILRGDVCTVALNPGFLLQILSPARLPRSQAPRNENMYTPSLFSRDQDVIEMGPKTNVLRVLQPTLRSTLGVHDIRPR